MRFGIITLSILFIATSIFPQAISVSPEFPTENDLITITFRADEAENNSLVNYGGTLYAHTGVLTNKSSDDDDWRYVIGTWGNNSLQPALTRIDANTYELEIGNLREFYSINNDPTEIIERIAFVFRSADGNLQTENIYVTIYEPGLAVTINSPAQFPVYPELGETVDFNIATNRTATISLFLDGILVATADSNQLLYSFTSEAPGRTSILITANDSTETVRDSTHLFVREPLVISDPPENILPGITYVDPNTVVLALYAPGKDFVYLSGDFNDWLFDPESDSTWEFDTDYYMNLSLDSTIFWKTITGLTSGDEYAFQYIINGNLRIADPYTEKILDPNHDSGILPETYPDLKSYPTGKTTEIVSVLQTNKPEYGWVVENFEKPAKEDLVIYELLLRDFLEEHDFSTLKDTLSYLKTLGINAIELMPVNEFEGNNSWGYNPSFYFAVDKYYGPANDLKELIDECHNNGIAVIMDMVLNHSYGQSPFVRLYASGNYGPPTNDNPWYNVSSPNTSFSWGYDFNHESQQTQQLVDRILKYWVEEFKFDGFRLDFTKGFTQRTGDGWAYDASRIAILKRIADEVWSTDPHTYMILEHLTDNSEEKELAEYGMMLWGNMNHNYNEATMGYTDDDKSDLSGASYKSRDWNSPNLISYMESHDEERLMFKNLAYGNSSGSYDITQLNYALQRMKLASAFFFTIPGPKMMWQFGELGYDYSINYPSLTSSDRLTQKPIRWDYLEIETRNNLFNVFSELINLKINHKVFSTDDFVLDVAGSTKTIHLNSDTMNVFVVGYFGMGSNTFGYTFQHDGKWYDFFNADSIDVSGNYTIRLEPGDFYLFTDKRIFVSDKDIILNLETDKDIIPQEFALYNSYPNPFNPTTKITYQVPRAEVESVVTLKIYDTLGREITTLVHRKQSPGRYDVTWNAKGLASGVYFYQLTAGNFKETKKMILMK